MAKCMERMARQISCRSCIIFVTSYREYAVEAFDVNAVHYLVKRMKSVNVTFRVDEELKSQADQLFADLGMSLSTAFNIFLRQSVREQQIPFAISRNVPNGVTQAAMEAAENNEDIYGPFDSVSELMEALNA